MISAIPPGLQPALGTRPLSVQRTIVIPPADPKRPREALDLGEIAVQ